MYGSAPTPPGSVYGKMKDFRADCITTIADPSAFAGELGAAFAAQSSWSDVDLDAWGKMVRQWRPPGIGDKMVWVHHGPVWYSDDCEELVESFPILHRGVLVSFVKQVRLAPQKEYRFTVKMDGKPRESQFFLPITPELRKLTSID